jgi:hypothetical protein
MYLYGVEPVLTAGGKKLGLLSLFLFYGWMSPRSGWGGREGERHNSEVLLILNWRRSKSSRRAFSKINTGFPLRDL